MSKIARRARRRAAWAGVLASAPTANELADDPLDHPRTARVGLIVMAPMLVFAAVGAHVVFTSAIWAAGAVFGDDRERERDEKVTVAVVEDPAPPPEPEPVPEPEPPPPEPEPPKPKPKPAGKPPPPPPEQPPPQQPPPKLVGVDIGSTVAGGSGPTFATGEGLAGETAGTQQVAARKATTRAAPEAPVETRTNRTATRIPTKGVELVKPKRLSAIKPTYPPTLRAQGVEADVVVEVRVDPTGNVVAASIVVPSEHPEMNEEALAAARREKFSPATRDGTAIDFTLTYTVRFRLSDS